MTRPTTNSVALIVGGSSGMGLETARLLRARGFDLMILVANNRAKLKKGPRADLAGAPGGTIDLASVDLYDGRPWTRLIARIAAEAATSNTWSMRQAPSGRTLFMDHTGDDYDRYMDLNKAFFFVTQGVPRNMKAHGGGSIVNIGSMWAKQAIKATPSSAYSMAKAGLHALTQHLAMELADHNIQVNAVSPAVVVTRSTAPSSTRPPSRRR